MTKFLAVWLTLLVALANPQEHPTESVWVPASNSSVMLLQGDDYRCTTWAVAVHVAFTAAHCIPEYAKPGEVVGSVKTAAGWVPARLVSVGKPDYVHDYALIRVDADMKPLSLRMQIPESTEKLRALGFAGEEQLTTTEVHTIGPKLILGTFLALFSYNARHGDSGGVIVDEQGRAVALVFAGNDALTLTLAVPAFELARVLEEAQ